jgi:hypothetical protein
MTALRVRSTSPMLALPTALPMLPITLLALVLLVRPDLTSLLILRMLPMACLFPTWKLLLTAHPTLLLLHHPTPPPIPSSPFPTLARTMTPKTHTRQRRPSPRPLATAETMMPPKMITTLCPGHISSVAFDFETPMLLNDQWGVSSFKEALIRGERAQPRRS